jgi:hypothetical protein
MSDRLPAEMRGPDNQDDYGRDTQEDHKHEQARQDSARSTGSRCPLHCCCHLRTYWSVLLYEEL